MSDLRFSDKRMTGGSLARRILFLSLFFLVIPLMVYTFFAFQADYRARLRDLFLALDAIGKGQERLLESKINSQHENLHLFTYLLDLEHPQTNLSKEFQEVARRENFSSFFFLTQMKGQGTICTFSSDPRLIESTDLFTRELAQVVGEGPFLGINPASQLKELFVSIVVTSGTSGSPLGYLICGMDAKKLINGLSQIEGIPYAFQLTLLTELDEPFVSTDPTVSLDKIHLLNPPDVIKKDRAFFQFAKVEEESSFFRLFKKGDEKEKIGLKLPIEDSTFTLLIDLPEKLSFEASKEELFFRLAKLLLLIIVIGGTLTWLMVKRMTRPLKALAKTMARVKEGHLSSRYENDLFGFEINALGERFNQMAEGLVQTIEEVKTERVAKELLLRELKIGHEIQKSIFPKEIPEIKGVEIASGFLPAHEVTGDFYDLFLQNENRENSLYITLGDASGKGISAALFAFSLRSILRAVFQSMTHSFKERIERVNQLFCQDTRDSGYFATAWIGKIDLQNQMIEYTSCGHLPTLLIRDGKVGELGTKGCALGVLPELEQETLSLQLRPGDLLILYSDGVIEAHDPQGKLFGMQRLQAAALELRSPSADQLLNHLLQKIQEFSGSHQHDDITLLILKMK